jgi:hypothetical protein
MFTRHATYSESLLARKGDVEYACILWSEPVVLVSCRIWMWMVLWFVMVLDVCVCISLRKLVKAEDRFFFIIDYNDYIKKHNRYNRL